MTRPRISVVVNTLNEEARLPYALRSVRTWVDEILVVDMRSDDRTADIARGFGAIVLEHERLGYADPARAHGIERATGDWILIVDADEIVPAPLARRLVEVTTAGDADAVSIAWRNHLLGAPLAHTGWGPEQDRHVRFFRAGAVTTSADIHDYIKLAPDARVLSLAATPDLCVTHFNYVDVSHFLEKLDRYTTIEARDALARGERGGRGRAVLAAGREIAARLIGRGGFQDGWRGFYLSALMGFYRFVTVAKLDELRRNRGREAVEERYRREAERLLEAYEQSGSEAVPPDDSDRVAAT